MSSITVVPTVQVAPSVENQCQPQRKTGHRKTYTKRQKGPDMTTTQNTEFQQLLDTWNKHQELRQNGANVADLFASRTKLERVRRDMAAAA